MPTTLTPNQANRLTRWADGLAHGPAGSRLRVTDNALVRRGCLEWSGPMLVLTPMGRALLDSRA